MPFEYGNDFGGTDETVLSEAHDKPVMVHRYPASVKAFYMHPIRSTPSSRCAWTSWPRKVMARSSAQPEDHDYQLLQQRIKEHNLPMEAFEWYMDLRRYGTVPHSGFGMGSNEWFRDLQTGSCS